MRSKIDASENESIVNELTVFLKELDQYWEYRILKLNGETKDSDLLNIENLRELLVRKSGKYKELIIQLTGKDKIHVGKRGIEYDVDMWLAALCFNFDLQANNALNFCKDVTNQAIGKLESDIKDGARDKQGYIISGNTKPIIAFISHEG